MEYLLGRRSRNSWTILDLSYRARNVRGYLEWINAGEDSTESL